MTSRLTDDRLPALGRIVHEVAADLTVVLGGMKPVAKSA
jgi:IclR family acetate operon transcriptional repressor